MSEMEYYKSIVTDEEVINALIKESKDREGEVEKSRVRPNLQFFQRTVSNLVSSNNRITVNQEKIIAKEKEKNKTFKSKTVPVRKKMPIDYIKEILSNSVEFVKSIEDNEIKKDDAAECKSSAVSHSPGQNLRQKKTFICKKTPFQQIREILTNNSNKSEQKHTTAVDTSLQINNSCVGKRYLNKCPLIKGTLSATKMSTKGRYSESPEFFTSSSEVSTSRLYPKKNEFKCSKSSISSKAKISKKRRYTSSSEDELSGHSSSPRINTKIAATSSFTSEIKKPKTRERSTSSEISIISLSDTTSDSDVCEIVEQSSPGHKS